MAIDDVVIVCSHDATDEMVNNLKEAIVNGKVDSPVYVSRANWKPVNKEDILKLYDELHELVKSAGWRKIE